MRVEGGRFCFLESQECRVSTLEERKMSGKEVTEPISLYAAAVPSLEKGQAAPRLCGAEGAEDRSLRGDCPET